MQTTGFKLDYTVPTFNFMLRGQQYALTHQQSVNAILPATGPDSRRVLSRGSQFVNIDAWTARAFVKELCSWAAKNPGCVPTRLDVEEWVTAANQMSVPNPHIVIAQTPDRLPLPTALALTGGAYHEAFHTLYTRRTNLKADEVFHLVITRWPLVPDWSKYHSLLQTTNNIIEDIRIERNGCREFPGIRSKMGELQNFILNMEEKGDETARAHAISKGKKPRKPEALSLVLKAFRDIGLGYATPRQHRALAEYRAENPIAVQLVLDGPLSPLLREAIALDDDDLGCIRIAFDLVAILVALSQAGEPGDGESDEDEEGEEGQEGQGKVECAQCQAPGHKLIVRPKAGTDQKVGIMTCTVCGHQQEVDLEDPNTKEGRQGKPPKPEDTPRFVGFKMEQDESEEGEGEGEGEGDGEEGEGEDSEQGSAGSESPDEPNLGDESDPGRGGDQGKESEGPKAADLSQGGAAGSSGGSTDPSDHGITEQFDQIAEDILAGAEKDEDTGMMDASQALGEAVGAANDKADAEIKPQDDEQVWKPADPNLDEVRMIEPSRSNTGVANQDHDRKRAEDMIKSVMPQIRYLRSRLRTVVKASEMVDTIHGLRKGRALSDRFLVDSKISLMSGQMPSRAYMETDENIDTSTAVAIVLDESGSMHNIRYDTARGVLSVIEPMDRLGCASLVCGVRNGRRAPYGSSYDESHHRREGVVIDIFKGWHERFQSVKWRFANTLAEGGTPLSDGMQYGLEALNYRNEGHRVMFVFTDGCPNYNHVGVMKWQFRVAKAAGIHVIGVGLGNDAKYVKELFPDYIWAENLKGLPKQLIAKLNQLFDRRCAKRGQRMNLRR